MRRLLRRYPQRVLVAAVVVVVAGSIALVLLGVDPNVIAAIASALAALAALGSATSSNQTARDAVRALSYATKPVIGTQLFWADGQPTQLLVVNESDFVISRLEIRVDLRDGRSISHTHGELLGRAHHGAPAQGRATVEFPEQEAVTGIDIATIDCWGGHGSMGWRRVVEMRHVHSLEHGVRGHASATRHLPETEIL